MNIEMMGVNYVQLAIAKTDYLIPHINENDREPSWDGDVEVYGKAGNTHAKADLILKVPVQIKGHIESNLKKQTIAYAVELSDLRNYLNAGGTVFLVVYVDKEGEKSQIYYNTLLPYELRKLVSKYGEQKKKSIKLKSFPRSKNDIADVFLFAVTHMRKQRSAISCDPISMEDLVKTGRIPELNFGYTRIPDSNDNFLDYLFDHDTYIYAKLDYGLELPIEHISGLKKLEATIKEPVSVDGHVFYTQLGAIHSKNAIEIHFGKGLKILIDQITGNHKFLFVGAGTLAERIIDADFMLQAIKAQYFEIGTTTFPFICTLSDESQQDEIRDREDYLAWLKIVQSLLDKLGVIGELDCDNVSTEDEGMLRKLVASVIQGESIEWTESDESFPDISIANLKIKLCVLQDQSKPEYFRIFGYSNAPVGYRMRDDEGREVEVSYHVFLKKKSMLSCCNIDYTEIVCQLKRFPISGKYSGALVWLLLEMLSAYDESGSIRNDILQAAIELSDWLRNTDLYTSQDLLDLNYYQAIKRSRKLQECEIQCLHSIVDSRPIRKDIYVAAYLLLDDYISAQYHYESMDEKEQNVFRTYPISHFLPPMW